jgi:Polyketide cyclase / dehydrase and lipid transport
MLRKLLLVLAIIIIGLFVFISLSSDEFKVSRTATIQAAPGLVYGQVNDLKNWKMWSPWEHIDPKRKTEFSQIHSGTGSSMSWESEHPDVGYGRITIMSCIENKSMRYQILFEKPMKAVYQGSFTFVPKGENQTEVTWSMEGTNDFLSKAVNLVFNIDEAVAHKFDEGLYVLNRLCMANPK